MNTFPSRIIGVRTKHFIAVLMEQHLSEKFINECIDEAMRREEQAKRVYPFEENIRKMAMRLL